jgi:hypothetical protein
LNAANPSLGNSSEAGLQNGFKFPLKYFLRHYKTLIGKSEDTLPCLVKLTLKETMMKFALIGAALLATAALGTPVQAQEVISNPGYCAFFYPNANCQNKGPGNPYTDRSHANLQPLNHWRRVDARHHRMY